MYISMTLASVRDVTACGFEPAIPHLLYLIGSRRNKLVSASHQETAENCVDGCQNPRKDGAAEKIGIALALTSAAPCRRTLGVKRWRSRVVSVDGKSTIH